MTDDLVNTLSELRITMFGRKKIRAYADVSRVPARATVVGAIDASGRDRDVHPVFVRGIRKDGVQTQAAAAGLPLRPVRMIEKTFHQRPARACVVRSKKRGRFDAAEERVRLIRMPLFNLPDLL